jgi:hypothetical protein
MGSSFVSVYQGRKVQMDSCDARARFDRRRGRCKSLGGFNARANALPRSLAVIDAAPNLLG